MAAVMLFLRQTTGKTERCTHFCMPLKPVFTRDCGDRVHFMDEPFNGLDEESGHKMMELLRSMNRDKGTTIVIVSHDLEGIRSLCHRVYRVHRRRIEEC